MLLFGSSKHYIEYVPALMFILTCILRIKDCLVWNDWSFSTLDNEQWGIQLHQKCCATAVDDRHCFCRLCGKVVVKKMSLRLLKEPSTNIHINNAKRNTMLIISHILGYRFRSPWPSSGPLAAQCSTNEMFALPLEVRSREYDTIICTCIWACRIPSNQNTVL